MVHSFPPLPITPTVTPSMEFLPFRSSRTPSKTQPPTETVPPNFRSLFSDALLDYRKRTGEDLLLHPLASKLKNCDSPGTILPVLLEEQTRALGQPRINDESSTQSQWLRTTVPVLYRLSQGIENTTDLVIIRLYSFRRCILPFFF